jgi:hypothetical protein
LNAIERLEKRNRFMTNSREKEALQELEYWKKVYNNKYDVHVSCTDTDA